MGSSSNFGVNPTLYKNLPYDAVRDFAPVSLVSFAPNALYVHPSVPAQHGEGARRAREEQARARSTSRRRGRAVRTTWRASSSSWWRASTSSTSPTKGPGRRSPIPSAVRCRCSSARSSRCCRTSRPGSCARSRSPCRAASPALPQVPTMAEAGYPAVETTVWNGVLVPAKTPPAIVEKLNAEIVADPQETGGSRALRRAGRRSGRQHERGIRGAHPARDRQVGQGRARRQTDGQLERVERG